MEQSVQPSTASQITRIIEVETYNVYSVNKVLLQQILETIGTNHKENTRKESTTDHETKACGT